MNSETKSKIKVLLVDDHPLVLAGVRSFLMGYDRFDVVGEASSGPEAINRAKNCDPDVVVMDLTMPGMNGLEATKCLRAMCPQIKVLILTIHEKREFIREMIQAGARGYVRKSTAPGELVSAIESVHRGEIYFMPDVAQAFFKEYVLNAGRIEDSSPKRLSRREHEVLELIVDGLANKQIADRLQLSVRTAEKHRQRIMEKLGIHRATELVRVAITRGFVNLSKETIPFVPSSQTPERRTL